MAVNQKMIFVYDDFSTDQSVLMDKCYQRRRILFI